MSPRPPEAAPDDSGPIDAKGMIRLERATLGVNVIAGAALAILIALVADVRGSIAALSSRVEGAIRDVAVIQSQGLDAHVRDLERRMATVEAQAHKPGGDR